MSAPSILPPSRTFAGPLLLPAKPWFIWLSLIAAFCLNLLPWPRDWVAPDWFALVLVFWAMHEPRRVGLSAAFVFGLLTDVHEGAALGQHALAYVMLSYFAIMLHRRVLGFGLVGQALHVLPLLLVAQLLALLVRALAVGQWPSDWLWLFDLMLATALWPLAHALLLAPQRRPVNPDANRPI